MQIKQATFVKSSAKYNQLPESELPEIAVIGRSNVGKSSLINMLVQRKQLAKSSATPGKTQLINFFLINDTWHLVDLPGYGYAKAGAKKKAQRMEIIYQYFTQREQLKKVFVLIDGKIPPQQIDLNFITQLQNENIPYVIIVTKIDKVIQKDLNKNLKLFRIKSKEQGIELPDILLSSSAKKKGREKILDYIESIVS